MPHIIKIDKPETSQNFRNIKKTLNFYQNIATIRDIKKMNTIPLPSQETCVKISYKKDRAPIQCNP